MCIFNSPVHEVSKTHILTSPTVDDRALVIYENTVSLEGGRGGGWDRLPKLKSKEESKNAMILPAPLHPGRDIVMVNLSEPEAFSFSNCEKCFLQAKESSTERLQKGASRGLSSSFLAVESVGAYQVSIAKTLEDIKRIDPAYFTVNENIYELLSAHYAEGFGFVICVFDANLGVKPHPIAYVCDKEADGNYFVPCRHEHGNTDADTAGFYHYFYSVNTNSDAGQSVEEREKQWIRYKDDPNWELKFPTMTPRDLFMQGPLKDIVPVDDIKSFRRKEMWGRYKNTDLHFHSYEVEPEKRKGPEILPYEGGSEPGILSSALRFFNVLPQ